MLAARGVQGRRLDWGTAEFTVCDLSTLNLHLEPVLNFCPLPADPRGLFSWEYVPVKKGGAGLSQSGERFLEQNDVLLYKT